MGKISIDLSTIKAAGIYTIEIDNSQREVTNPTSLRLLPGFNNKGPFNRPVFMQYESERQKIFGDIDNKLEQKGCFFNRMAQTMLKNGPVLALNLLKVDESIDGPDQVNYAAMSLDSCKANPKVVSAGKQYGEYDYQAKTIDNMLYGTQEGDIIPYVGKTPYSSLFDRSRFWIPSKNNLQAVAANGLITNDEGTYEHTNLLNFANTGTDEISILVYKPEGLKGYDVTAKEWWGGNENIPYGWIRPSDYISDYFIRVVAVKGNWTNYPVLSNDPIWHKYFNKNGVIKDKVGTFCSAEGITFIGSWTGTIIPDFVDKQGNYLYIESKVNAATERTGLLMSINEDALQVISYDKNGVDNVLGNHNGVGSWIYDFDGNAQAESELGEGEVDNNAFLVDMVGHNLQRGIYSSDFYMNLAHPISQAGTVADAVKAPTAWFLKTNGTLTDKNAWFMTFNGRETADTSDDVLPAATARVINGSGTNNWNMAYVVYDAKTNKPIKGNGKLAGVKNYFVSINSSVSDPTSSKTSQIKSMTAFGQLNDNVSYNENDQIKSITIGSKTIFKTVGEMTETEKTSAETKTINDIIGIDENEHDLKLVAVPVKKDTNDTFIYKNVDLYYGVYAIPNSTDASVTLFAVTGGLKAGSFATISDIDTITTQTTKNVLEEHTAALGNAIPTKEDVSANAPTDTDGYTFSYGGNEYFMSKTGNKLYKKIQAETPTYFGVNFLSYNYITTNVNEAVTDVYHAYYFNGWKNMSSMAESLVQPASVNNKGLQLGELYNDSQEVPVTDTNLNTFIVVNEVEASHISVGDYVNNIAYYNNVGEAEKYNLIPGITRVISKVFVNVDSRMEFYYKGKKYRINVAALENTPSGLIETKTGKRGFYLFTTHEPVYISKTNFITRQIPITSDTISHSLKFIPLKGLHISAKHRPGFDEYGRVDIEGGIKKIYSMLEEDGIHRGLCNPNMVDYRYVVDSMSYGLSNELGGKVYLSRLAADRMKTTALLNLPSKRQFELSTNPCFCDTYEQGVYTKPPFDTKYIPTGGNSDLYNTLTFSLPTEDDGSKFAAAFWPHLTYSVNGRKINVPPAADVCDVLIRKFQGGDPYVIAANRNGIIKNSDVTGIEFMADAKDREYLEPFGVNTIIQEGNNILIYGNQTCYQDTKSDFNKLHVRENLNTLEIACEAVLKTYNFLYNTPAVRASVVTALTPILETMKLSQAIEKYNIVCDESNNTPDIIAEDYGIVDIEVWMSHGMEKIVQRITLNRRDTLAD